MKERPILFNGEMVRAVMDGCKTQTRRVIKPQPWNEADRTAGGCGFAWGRKGYDSRAIYWNTTEQSLAGSMIGECPYGQPGDRLWVRETWAQHPEVPWEWMYRADRGGDYQGAAQGLFKWSPSIHMPRCVSRTDLEIESVRVERVQSISDFDAFQEGAKSLPSNITGPYCQSHVEGFRQLWDSINGARGFGWDVNPFVWVITFRRVK